MNLNEYNALRRVTDAVRAADSAFCEDFYNDEPFTDMIIDNETYRRDARKRRRIVAG